MDPNVLTHLANAYRAQRDQALEWHAGVNAELQMALAKVKELEERVGKLTNELEDLQASNLEDTLHD